MKTTCIMCPMGCQLNIDKNEEGNIIVTGNTCKRGAICGEQEFVCPKRVVTSLAKTEDGRVISVKTDNAIDKTLIFDVLHQLKEISVKTPLDVGDIIIENVCNSGANIVATSSMDKK